MPLAPLDAIANAINDPECKYEAVTYECRNGINGKLYKPEISEKGVWTMKEPEDGEGGGTIICRVTEYLARKFDTKKIQFDNSPINKKLELYRYRPFFEKLDILDELVIRMLTARKYQNFVNLSDPANSEISETSPEQIAISLTIGRRPYLEAVIAKTTKARTPLPPAETSMQLTYSKNLNDRDSPAGVSAEFTSNDSPTPLRSPYKINFENFPADKADCPSKEDVFGPEEDCERGKECEVGSKVLEKRWWQNGNCYGKFSLTKGHFVGVAIEEVLRQAEARIRDPHPKFQFFVQKPATVLLTKRVELPEIGSWTREHTGSGTVCGPGKPERARTKICPLYHHPDLKKGGLVHDLWPEQNQANVYVLPKDVMERIVALLNWDPKSLTGGLYFQFNKPMHGLDEAANKPITLRLGESGDALNGVLAEFFALLTRYLQPGLENTNSNKQVKIVVPPSQHRRGDILNASEFTTGILLKQKNGKDWRAMTLAGGFDVKAWLSAFEKWRNGEKSLDEFILSGATISLKFSAHRVLGELKKLLNSPTPYGTSSVQIPEGKKNLKGIMCTKFSCATKGIKI